MKQILAWLVAAAILLSGGLATGEADDRGTSEPLGLRFPDEQKPAFVVEVTGSGPPVILIPGLMCSARVWDETVATLSKSHTCHAITINGFGGLPYQGPPMLETVKTGVIEYMEKNDLRDVVVIGHSLGGFLAFWVASEKPSRLRAIVAVDGVPFLPALADARATSGTTRLQAEMMRQQIGSLPREGFRRMAGISTGQMIGNKDRHDDMAAMAELADPAATGQAMYDLQTTDLRPRVKDIGVPILMLNGAGLANHDALARNLAIEFQKQIRTAQRARFVQLRKARHFIMYDDFDGMMAAINDFLKDPPTTCEDLDSTRTIPKEVPE